MPTFKIHGKQGTPESVREIRLIPFVCGAGARIPGTERGPAEMHARGLQKALPGAVWQAHPAVLYQQERAFYKALPEIGSAERRRAVLESCRHIAGEVEKAVKAGALPVTLGGDHAMAAGSVAGFARAKQAHGRIGLIWVDAHADLHTMETSPSKTYHGMPVAMLLGLGDGDFAGIGGIAPVLRPEHVVYIGLRSTEPEEDQRIRDMGIKAYNMKEIATAGAQAVFREAFAALAGRVDHIILSIDLDAFDPADAPAVGSPVQGGLQRTDVLAALRALAGQRPFDMVEIAEFNPELPGAEKTYALLVDVLKAALATSC